MKYFSEDKEFVNAECEVCNKILKIKKTFCKFSSDKITCSQPIKCFCSNVSNEIKIDNKRQDNVDYTSGKLRVSPTITSCRHCSKEVARTAEICPHCGGKRPGLTNKQYKNVIIVTLVITLFFAIWMHNKCSRISDDLEQTGRKIERSLSDFQRK